MSCSIILPCYNPQPQWVHRVVEQYNTIVALLNTTVTIILVNDGSTVGVTDEDILLLKEAIPKFQYITYTENKGKGYAVRQGVTVAATDIIIYTDIDFPYTTQSLLSIYNALSNDNVAIAAGIKNDTYYSKVPLVRKRISKILQSLTGMFFNIPVTDTQCGLKGFRGEVKDVFLTTTINRYLFDLEFIRAAHKRQYTIHEVSVQLNDNVVFKQMNYKMLFTEFINFIRLMML